MLIKKLKITNFRQYKNVELEFSTDSEKNLTVILGENGYGKTTLVRAFIWCLYRDPKLFKTPILLNDDVATKMMQGSEEKVEVQLDLEHGGINYRITTTEKYKKDYFDKVSVSSKAATSIIRDSNPLYSGAVDTEINKILKKDLKDYFFYDGENNKIESMSKKQSLKDAISQMMGIKRLETLKSYFHPTGSSGVVGVLNSELSGSAIELIPIRDQLKEAEDKKTIENNNLSENDAEIVKLENSREEKQSIIDANKDIEEDQNRLKFLKNKVQKDQEKVNESFQKNINHFNGKNNIFLKSLFSKCFTKYNLKQLGLNSSFGTDQSLSHISEEVIDQLIQRGYCLCGTKIKDKNEAYTHLIEAKSHMEPHDFGKYLSDFLDSEQHNVDSSKMEMDTNRQSIDEFLSLLEEIDDDKESINEITKKIAGREDVGKYQVEVDELSAQINRLEGQNEYISNTIIPSLDKNINNLYDQLQKAAEKNKENDLINLCIQYANAIYSQTEKKIIKAQNDTRINLEREVNEIFSVMYHGERSIEIDKDFNIITKAGSSILDNSTGTDTVKNFAFVAGLLNSIKNSVLKDELSDEEDERYPLVMDAPFSDTDTEHIKNICKTLPKYCDQIFIIVINKDFEVAKNDIKDRIGKLYQINKHSEKLATIEQKEI